MLDKDITGLVFNHTKYLPDKTGIEAIINVTGSGWNDPAGLSSSSGNFEQGDKVLIVGEAYQIDIGNKDWTFMYLCRNITRNTAKAWFLPSFLEIGGVTSLLNHLYQAFSLFARKALSL